MFSTGYIHELQAKAARDAARRGRKPFVIFNEAEVDGYGARPGGAFPFPFIGTHVPKGWRPLPSDGGVKIDHLWRPDTGLAYLFADATGWGRDGELALSVRQLREVLKGAVRSAAKARKTIGFAVVEVGQFQVVIGVFEKVEAQGR